MEKQIAPILALLSKYDKVDLSKLKVTTEYIQLGGISNAAIVAQKVAEGQKQIVGGTHVAKYNINELSGEIKIVGIAGHVVSSERVTLPRVVIYKCPVCGTKFRKVYSVLHAISDHIKRRDWTSSVCPACRYEAKISMEDKQEVYSMARLTVADGTGTITVYAPQDMYNGVSGYVAITGIYMPHPLGHFIYATGIDGNVADSVSHENVLDAVFRFTTADTYSVVAIFASAVKPSRHESMRTLIFVTRRGYGTWQHIYRVLTSVAVKTRISQLPRLKLHPSTPVITPAYGTEQEIDVLNDVFSGTLYYGGYYVSVPNNLIVYTTSYKTFQTLRRMSWDLVAIISRPHTTTPSYQDTIIRGLRNAILKEWHVDVPNCERKICKSTYKLVKKRVEASVVHS